MKNLAKDYLTKEDWRVKENASFNYSLQGMNSYIASEVTKKHWLSYYPEHIIKANDDGFIYIHDLGIFGAYCGGHNLEALLNEGFGGAKDKIHSSAPKHFSTALGQINNLFFTLSGEFAGAQAFSNFDTLLAPYVWRDSLSYDEIKQAMQEFIFSLNIPTRIGFMQPFTNLTFDLVVPEKYKNKKINIAGKEYSKTYGEMQPYMDMINKAFCEIMVKGDSIGSIFTFPIPTYNLTKDFDWDNVLPEIWEMTAKYGLPYFANYINSEMSADDSLSMCCFVKNTEILYREDEEGNLSKSTMEDAPDDVFLLTVNGFKKAKKVIINNDSRKMFEVSFLKFRNRDEGFRVEKVVMTEDHLNMMYGQDQDKHAKDLVVGNAICHLVVPAPFWHQYARIEPALVVEIKEVEYYGKYYCYQMEDQSHPYFMLANGLYTHNCRLKINLADVRKRGNGLFSAHPNTGSIGVVTLNLPKIIHHHGLNFDAIQQYANIAKEALEIKRKVIEEYSDKELYPYATHLLREVKECTGKYWGNHFSTIGIIGMHEALLEAGKEGGVIKNMHFAESIMEYLQKLTLQYQEETGNMYNLEATPAEGCTYTLARKGKRQGIVTSGKKYPYYTNSVHFPVGHEIDLFDMIKSQEKIQSLFTGGTVLHLFLGEAIPDPMVVKSLVKKVATQSTIPYFSITPTFSVCPEHGYLSGEHFECPTCKSKSDVYSRIVGYFRPVKNWNEGKQSEYNDRKTYRLEVKNVSDF